MPRTPKGSFFARKRDKWYPVDRIPKGVKARIWFRICIDGERHAINMKTSDVREAERRRNAWMAGLRLDTYEEFLQSLCDVGQKARHELDRRMAGKGVTPAKGG